MQQTSRDQAQVGHARPLRVSCITLFPELIARFFAVGLVAKAQERGIIDGRAVALRSFGAGVHRSVDDTPYGGGCGMVLRPGPVVAALEAVDPRPMACSPTDPVAKRVLLSPQGRPFCQREAQRLAAWAERAGSGATGAHLVLVCGRYEGFDERIRSYVDEELSLGDFVLLGGEAAAMAIVESVGRLLPGFLGNAASAQDESHADGLLEYPQYTRPRSFRGLAVPEVLLSGDHAAVASWRAEQSHRRTAERRPDLWAARAADAPRHSQGNPARGERIPTRNRKPARGESPVQGDKPAPGEQSRKGLLAQEDLLRAQAIVAEEEQT